MLIQKRKEVNFAQFARIYACEGLGHLNPSACAPPEEEARKKQYWSVTVPSGQTGPLGEFLFLHEFFFNFNYSDTQF